MHTFTKLLLAAGLALTGSQAAQAQQLLENFENTRLVDYPTLQGTLTVVANPASVAPNTSTSVGKYDRNGAEQYATVAMQLKNGARFADAADYVSTTSTKRLSILFRHNTGATVPVQLVLQNRAKAIVPPYYPGGNFGIFNATATASTDWQTLTFTYTVVGGGTDPTVTATDVDQIAMLIAPGTSSGATYYFDDVKGPAVSTTTPPTTGYQLDQLYDNNDGTRVIRYKKPPTDGTFKRDTLAPTLTPAMANNHVFRYTRSAAQYDGLYLQPVGAPLADVTPFVNGTKRMTMRMWSPAVGTRFQISLTDSTKTTATNYPTGRHSEYLATSTVANAWETLVFAFSQRPDGAMPSTGLNEIVLLINTNTTAKLKVYIDDWTGPRIVGYLAAKPAATSTAALDNPYPNPSTGLSRLPFSLKQGAVVSLDVYDNAGRRVLQVIDGKAYPVGEHAADISTSRLAAGLYTCRLTVDGTVLSRQLSVE